MENVKKLGIIPARYASTRFPGKPLALINGVAMIERVYKQCLKSDLDAVIIATDDDRIKDCALGFGAEVVMTDADLPSGTDRCVQAYQRFLRKHASIDVDSIINIQGDEPFIDPAQINTLLDLLKNPAVEIATLVSPAVSQAEVDHPNRVKVVRQIDGRAIYFSRSPIPYFRNENNGNSYYEQCFIHLGIYGFSAATFQGLPALVPSFLELSEGLEQLRWIENGLHIQTAITIERSEAVDSPEDLVALEKKFFLDGSRT